MKGNGGKAGRNTGWRGGDECEEPKRTGHFNVGFLKKASRSWSLELGLKDCEDLNSQA